MPALKDRHLVVSRSKDHREIYETVSEWLNTTNYFKWTDDSVTYNDELEGVELKRRRLLLRRRIETCSCVVLFAGDVCRVPGRDGSCDRCGDEFHKPLVGVKARDESPLPKRMQINCRVTVRYQRNVIVAAIQEHSL